MWEELYIDTWPRVRGVGRWWRGGYRFYVGCGWRGWLCSGEAIDTKSRVRGSADCCCFGDIIDAMLWARGVGRGRGAIIDAESGTSGVGENGEAINTKPRARGVAGYEMLCWEWGGGAVGEGWVGGIGGLEMLIRSVHASACTLRRTRCYTALLLAPESIKKRITLSACQFRDFRI